MQKNSTISLPVLDLSLSWRTIVKMLLLLLLLLGISITAIQLIGDPNNYRKNTEQNSQSSGNGSKQSNSKPDIKIDAQKRMYQDGKHFNKHGRAMGYASKEEYNNAAIRFAQENSKNANAQIFEGEWYIQATGEYEKQIAICHNNRTVIVDKISGQLIDFYEGTQMRGLVNLLKLQ